MFILWSGSFNFPRRCFHHVSLRRSFVTLHGNKSPSPPSTCVSSSLPACRCLSHWLASCGHRTGRLIGRLPLPLFPSPPPPLLSLPLLRQPAEEEGGSWLRVSSPLCLISPAGINPAGRILTLIFRVGGIKKIITKPDRMCSVFKWRWGPMLASSSDGMRRNPQPRRSDAEAAPIRNAPSLLADSRLLQSTDSP